MAVSLFQKYGGFGAISKLIMAFYDKAVESDVIGDYFEGVDMRRLVDHQTKFISALMGGPASYTDDALRQSHARLAIDKRAFEEMARLLELTLREAKLDPADVELVIDAVRSKEAVIVTAIKP